MNKQELIERIEGLKNLFGSKSKYIEIDAVIKLASELDKPQKVMIPQFVAEYIEFKKKYDFHVYGAMREIEDHYDKRVPEWFYKNNIETFVRAWLDGYEVAKEKRYTVKVKAYLGQFLGRYYLNNEELTPRFTRSQFTGKGEIPTFTRKELEGTGFGWVFDCPGIEIEEVEG